MKSIKLLFLMLMIPALSAAQPADNSALDNEQLKANRDEAVQVLNDFRTAIINNDSESASNLLTDDARILESGGIETKEEYLSHHFHSDGKFLSAMERHQMSQKVTSDGNTAWISTVTHMSGTYNERNIDISSAELAVVVKTEEGWKISAVHWSSRSNN